MAEARVPYRCDGCGQTDDHPKMHYGVQTYHHDCIPAFVMDDLTSESTYRVEGGQVSLLQRVPLPEEHMHPGTVRLLETRKKAESGTRGPALLKWIQAQKVVHELPDSDTQGRKITDTDEEN
jgi:hypothetical protein